MNPWCSWFKSLLILRLCTLFIHLAQWILNTFQFWIWRRSTVSKRWSGANWKTGMTDLVFEDMSIVIFRCQFVFCKIIRLPLRLRILHILLCLPDDVSSIFDIFGSSNSWIPPWFAWIFALETIKWLIVQRRSDRVTGFTQHAKIWFSTSVYGEYV